MRILIYFCVLIGLAGCGGQAILVPMPNAGSVELAQQQAQPKTSPSPAGSAFLGFDGKIHLIDVTTGKDVAGYAPITGDEPFFSEDGTKLATVETHGESCEAWGGGSLCHSTSSTVHMVEVQTRHEVTAALALEGWMTSLAFSPDTRTLAIGFHQPKSRLLLLVDTQNGEIVQQRALEFDATHLIFAPDGKTLAVYGQYAEQMASASQPPDPHILLVDAATLQTQWDQTLGDVLSGAWCKECAADYENQVMTQWSPAVLPAPDHHSLVILHADTDTLSTVDLTTGSMHTATVQAMGATFEDFLARFAGTAEAKGAMQGVTQYGVMSPEGTTLWAIAEKMTPIPEAAGGRETRYTADTLRAIDVASGRQVASQALPKLQGGSGYIESLAITFDGKHLLLVRAAENNTWQTDVFDTQTLKPSAQLDDWRVLTTYQRGGQPILLAHKPNVTPLQLGLVDPNTLQVTRTWQIDTYGGWVTP